MTKIALDKINLLTLHKQHLADESRIDDVVQITRDIAGLHATGTREPYLAAFARSQNFTKEQLDGELYIRRNLGKIRCMRGTLYILTREMLPIAYAATRALVEKLSRRYAEFRGISTSAYADISKAILDLLPGRELTVAEIKAALGTDLNLSAALNLMCDQGLLLRIQAGNGWKARSYKYAVFQEYLKDIDLNKWNESDGITKLVQQYLSSFGPVTEDDIAWWTGLTKTKIREALNRIRGQITQLNIPDLEGDFIVLRRDLELLSKTEPEDKPIINLLPTLDPYLMGYKHRERYLHLEHYDKIFDRSGNATSTILLNGVVIGVWDFVEKPKPTVKLYLLDKVASETLEKINLKSQQMGQFIAGEEVAVRGVSSMIPLRQRTAGAFMSPLKF